MNGLVRRRWTFFVLVLGVVLALLVGGCTWGRKAEPPREKGVAPKPAPEQPGPRKARVVLYFSDRNAEYLVKEEREIVVEGKSLAELALQELIRGPSQAGHIRTIPEGVRVLSVRISDRIAYADFSKELRTRHPGGSTGEIMTVYSIVNTLTEIPGIDKVQIMLEGQKEETLAGHLIISEPIARETKLIR